jgi:hypothetical protein
LSQHNNKLAPLLSSVYPEYEWLMWKFPRVGYSYWDNKENQRKFIDWIAMQWNIKEMSDWYKITVPVNITIKMILNNRMLDVLEVVHCLKNIIIPL